MKHVTSLMLLRLILLIDSFFSARSFATCRLFTSTRNTEHLFPYKSATGPRCRPTLPSCFDHATSAFGCSRVRTLHPDPWIFCHGTSTNNPGSFGAPPSHTANCFLSDTTASGHEHSTRPCACDGLALFSATLPAVARRQPG